MYDDSQADLKINGSGRASGGSYNFIKINGSGKIMGDVKCNELVINGSGEVNGKVESKIIRINGSGHINGELKTREIKINGSSDFDAEFSCDNISISGSAYIRKNLDAQTVKVNGSVKVDGDSNAETFNSCGMFEIGGLLNSDNINVELYWHRSYAKEIGGENIKIMVGKNRLGFFRSILSLGAHNPSLSADLIEGNDVTLENTIAKVVRGNNITIGKGCDIGLVEYKGIFNKTGDARVGEERKV